MNFSLTFVIRRRRLRRRRRDLFVHFAIIYLDLHNKRPAYKSVKALARSLTNKKKTFPFVNSTKTLEKFFFLYIVSHLHCVTLWRLLFFSILFDSRFPQFNVHVCVCVWCRAGVATHEMFARQPICYQRSCCQINMLPALIQLFWEKHKSGEAKEREKISWFSFKNESVQMCVTHTKTATLCVNAQMRTGKTWRSCLTKNVCSVNLCPNEYNLKTNWITILILFYENRLQYKWLKNINTFKYCSFPSWNSINFFQ